MLIIYTQKNYGKNLDEFFGKCGQLGFDAKRVLLWVVIGLKFCEDWC